MGRVGYRDAASNRHAKAYKLDGLARQYLFN
jgi:hypothetical protein